MLVVLQFKHQILALTDFVQQFNQRFNSFIGTQQLRVELLLLLLLLFLLLLDRRLVVTLLVLLGV